MTAPLRCTECDTDCDDDTHFDGIDPLCAVCCHQHGPCADDVIEVRSALLNEVEG